MRVFLLRKKSLTTTQIIAAGFLCAIILGTILLMLPVSSKAGVWTNPVDAMFTATTSACVTGLVTVSTAYLDSALYLYLYSLADWVS